MIVRNEAHIVHEVLEAVAPFITSWVIVDTGSDDGTQEAIRTRMRELGIPGELHERPWRNFGHNRSEALALAQGHGDYIWVMDADDTIVGIPDFSDLSADVYMLRYGAEFSYWRRQLFRDGVRWRYEGVVHEYAVCDDPTDEKRLEGEYYIESRRLGGRNLDPEKYARDRDLLLAEVERNPDDSRSAFYLAQSYFDLGDFAGAREWYARRAGMGGWDEEIYYALFRVAESMSLLGAPWPEVQDAYLRAWEARPTRAEPLHAIARRYRIDQRYQLGYLFAERAADIPLPSDDALFVGADIYAWRALDEQAICAFWIGKHLEALALCRRLLADDAVPEDERRRIAANRDYSVPALREAAVSYPDVLAGRLVRGPHDAKVTLSVVFGPDRTRGERTLNSFVRCCVDVPRIGRFLAVDAGLAPADRAEVETRYPFLEFVAVPDGRDVLEEVRSAVGGRFWLHLGKGWEFFAPERLITRLTAVLDAEPAAIQAGINLDDARALTGRCASVAEARRSADGGRYVIAAELSDGPSMFDVARLDTAGGVGVLMQRTVAAGIGAATLDEVLCVLPDVAELGEGHDLRPGA